MPQSLPWSNEIEKAILCCLISSPESQEELTSLLRPEHFYSDTHKFIMAQIQDMQRTQQPIDLPNLCERVRSQGLIDRAGGDIYLTQLTDPQNWSMNYHSDAMMLRKYALLRGLAKAGQAMMTRAIQGTDDPEEIGQSTTSFIQTLTRELLETHSTTSERDNAVSLCRSFDSSNPVVCVTGIPNLDETLGGFRPSELVIIAADTGVGKTIFARQIRRESCRRGVHGLYCSGEMDGEQLSAREASAHTGIPLWKFRNPWHLESEDHSKALDFAAHECSKCAVLSTNLSVSRIGAAASQMKREGNLGFIAVDYDELVEAPGGTDLERQAAVVRGCKSLSMSHNCPVILLSQLRKPLPQEKAGSPVIHRLYGSGSKVKDAAIILFIDRPFVRELQGDETEAKIFIIKNRNGSLGEMKCRFSISRMEFTEEIPI